MKKRVFKKSIWTVFAAVGMVSAPVLAAADAPEVKDECAKELLLSYFPEPIVRDTLKNFNVPQDKWDGIVKSLSSKDKEVVKIVEQKASTMNPNPLKDIQQRQAAVKLFRDTLLEVFSDALKENGVQDTSQFSAMLDQIQQQKAKKFAMCMEKHKAQLQNQQPGTTGSKASEEDEDEDDSDEDEDSDDDEKGEEAHKGQEEKKLVSPTNSDS